MKAALPLPDRLPRAGVRVVQAERLMHRPQRLDAVGLVHQHGDLDVAGGDHLHVDVSAARAANMRSATPVCVRMPVPTIDTLLTSSSCSTVGPQLVGQRLARRSSVAGSSLRRHGEADGRLAAAADVLGDHVHGDVVSAMAAKTRWLTPGWSGTPSRRRAPRP